VKASTRQGLFANCSALLVATAWSSAAAAATAATRAPGDDIRDIRALILIPPWWHGMVLWLSVALALAVAATAVWLWRRRSAGPLTPLQEAERALLRAESLAREGRSREWADLVARTLRAALSARIGQDACPKTTGELASVVWVTPPYDVVADAPCVIDLLSMCDLTRFAMARLDTDSLVRSTEGARDWTRRLFAPPLPSSATSPQVTR
jgi:hypothetical protein